MFGDFADGAVVVNVVIVSAMNVMQSIPTYLFVSLSVGLVGGAKKVRYDMLYL